MNFFSTYAKAHNEILRRIFQKKLLRDYRRYCTKKKGHALIYYKNDALVPGYIHTYNHTNNWSIAEMAKILNKMGYWVDVIDRGIDKPIKLDDKYDIFIGCGNSDSSRFYPELAKQIPSAKRVFFTTTADPNEHNRRIVERYNQFNKRTGLNLKPRRLNHHVDMQRAMTVTDAIISVANEFNNQGYKKYDKPLYSIYSPTSPHLHLKESEISKKSQKKFFFFGGNGNILKGLDLAIEAFAGLPDLELHIAGPIDPEFERHYKEIIQNSSNIRMHGFISVNGKEFHEITSKCGFIILPSCTEGAASSVTTCMRRGLIPIVTREAGIDVKDFGTFIEEPTVPSIQKLAKNLSQITNDEFHVRVKITYQDSVENTQESFRNNFTKIVTEILSEND